MIKMMNWQQMAKPLAAIALTGTLAISLQGCVAVIAGGAVVGGFAATDRRTLGAQTEDKEIALKANARLSSLIGDDGHVDVTSYNRKVLLTGEVKDENMKQSAEQEVKQITGVQGVMNELDIAGKSSFGSRSNDVYITSKISASFIDARELNANSIKIVTERGTVYLLGRVTQTEGKIAAERASSVGGVTRVVKMFEYITDDELREMTGPQGARS
ncbi:MAG TPA: BON domain-containing protein [Burkholderiaceae bacterium]|nr:BON domain-containing protein [Burkholderiaceae bacterium]